MKILRITLFLLFGIIILSGCAGSRIPSNETIAQAHYGTVPTNIENRSREAIERKLKDADSAKFSEFSEPYRGPVEEPPTGGHPTNSLN